MSERRDRVWTEAMHWVFEMDRHPRDLLREAELEHWLGQHHTHAEAYEQARLIWDAAPHLNPMPAKATPLPARPARRRFLAGGGALAAALALAWAGRGTLQNLWADYATGVGQTLAVELADGSRLQLNTDSAVKATLQAGMRRVDLLRGEVFITAQAASQPLEATAGRARLATRSAGFNLRLDAPGPSVAVASGEVQFWLDDGPRETLPPGMEAAWDATTASLNRSTASPAHMAAWRDGRLIVEHWPVARVLDEIGRYHPGAIVLADAALGRETVNGVYDLTRPADAARAVAQAFGGKVTEITPYVLVIARA
jgi:Fe2+-dicitrate sensor, membrane component